MTTADAPTVLLVDDDVQLLALYRDFLRDRFTVRTASSGEEALDRLDAAVDVVLLDRRMSGMSGDEVVVEIRSRGFDCPVTMVTSIEPDTDILALDLDDYLTKPVTKDELTELVETMLRRSQYDDPIREHFSIVSKLAALEADHPRKTLADNDEYRQLIDRLRSSRDGVESLLQEICNEADLLLRDIDLPRFRKAHYEE